jgi:hypothetical protein
MPTSRYSRTPIIGSPGRLATSDYVSTIRSAVSSGAVAHTESVLLEGQRLDHLAAKQYGDARYWWVIAAASGIGWALQAPPGTRLLIPISLEQVTRLL